MPLRGKMMLWLSASHELSPSKIIKARQQEQSHSPSHGMLKRTDLRFLAAILAFAAGLGASAAGLGAALLAAAPGLVLRKPAQCYQTVSHLSILATCGTQRQRGFQIYKILAAVAANALLHLAVALAPAV